MAAARLRASRRLARARLAGSRSAVVDRARSAGRPIRGARDRLPGPRRTQRARGDHRLPRARPVHLRVRRRGLRRSTGQLIPGSGPPFDSGCRTRQKRKVVSGRFRPSQRDVTGTPAPRGGFARAQDLGESDRAVCSRRATEWHDWYVAVVRPTTIVLPPGRTLQTRRRRKSNSGPFGAWVRRRPMRAKGYLCVDCGGPHLVWSRISFRPDHEPH